MTDPKGCWSKITIEGDDFYCTLQRGHTGDHQNRGTCDGDEPVTFTLTWPNGGEKKP